MRELPNLYSQFYEKKKKKQKRKICMHYALKSEFGGIQ